MKNLVNEVKSCLAANNYLASITLELIIPGICGSLEFPEIKGKGSERVRYSSWYAKFLAPFKIQQDKILGFEQWILNGDLLYLLRNSLFHEGSLNIEIEVLKKLNIKDFQRLVF